MSKQSTPLHGLERHLSKGRAERALLVERQAINDEARTAVLAFASELPYERWWGIEILDVTATSMRQSRLRSGANLLMDHDHKDVVGVIESVEIGADRVGRAVVRFGKSARAEEVWQDVRDGIRRNVSVGYMVHKAQLIEVDDGLETYRITDWEPFEVSLVSVPADATVGVGRSLENDERDVDPGAPDATPAAQAETQTQTHTPIKEKAMTIEVAEQRNHAAEISKIAASFPGGADLAMSAIQRGLTVEQFQREALDKLASAPVPTADIGMDKKEVRQYSFLRALNALANPGDAVAQHAAAFERECSDAAAAKLKRQPSGLCLNKVVDQRLSLVYCLLPAQWVPAYKLVGIFMWW